MQVSDPFLWTTQCRTFRTVPLVAVLMLTLQCRPTRDPSHIRVAGGGSTNPIYLSRMTTTMSPTRSVVYTATVTNHRSTRRGHSVSYLQAGMSCTLRSRDPWADPISRLLHVHNSRNRYHTKIVHRNQMAPTISQEGPMSQGLKTTEARHHRLYPYHHQERPQRQCSP